MANLFIIGDTHFGHANILGFLRKDGSRMREYRSVEEMDEDMVRRWNSVVRRQDHVYHLGDVVIHRKDMPICARLNGHKRLVRGNHDIHKTKDYLQYFEHIYGSRVIDNFIMTHIPIHPGSLGRFNANIHGHTHARTTRVEELGKRYYNVSVEAIHYMPIAYELLKADWSSRSD